jgi:hypothetical protein
MGSHVFRDVSRSRDSARKREIYAHFDEEQGDLLWVVPLTTDAGAGTAAEPPESAFVEHYLEHIDDRTPHPISKRDFPFTATGHYTQTGSLTWDDIDIMWSDASFAWDDPLYSAAFPLNLAGDDTGQIYTLNTSQQADESALPSFVRFGLRATGSGRERGLLKRIYPFVAPSTGVLEITPYFTDHAAGDLMPTDTLDFDLTLPEGLHFVSPFRRGRFWTVVFGSSAGVPWKLDGYDFDVVQGGLR